MLYSDAFTKTSCILVHPFSKVHHGGVFRSSVIRPRTKQLPKDFVLTTFLWSTPVWRFQSSAVFSFPGDVAGHFTTLLERFKLSGVFSFPGDVARQKYSREYPGEYCSSLSDPKLFITILFCLVTFSCPIFTRIHAYSCKQVTLLVPHQILSYDPRVVLVDAAMTADDSIQH